MMQESSVFSLWPSFNSYSNTGLAEIAARVVEEFGSAEFYDEFYFEREENPAAEEGENPEYVERERGNSVVQEEDDDEEEFEFAVVNRETEFSSPISADEIFHNGQIRPVYPVFDRDLFPKSMELQQAINGKEEKKVRNSGTSKGPTNRLPLRMLFIQERQTTMTMRRTSSSSSSEAEELDGVPADSYCVWRPHEAAGAEKRCKKSSSTGSSSKRWKFRDLLHRSPSDGSKGNPVILGLTNGGRRKLKEKREAPLSGGKVKPLPPTPGV